MLTSRLVAILVIAAAILTFGATMVYKIKKGAEDALISKFEKGEAKARLDAVSGARDVDACYAAGGMWSRSAGTCREPEGER